MPYIQLDDRQYTLTEGSTVIGGGADAQIKVDAAGGAQRLAVLQVTADKQVVIRRGDGAGSVLVNGVALGVEPSPLMHGDKIEVAGQEMLFGDDAKAGSTQFVHAPKVDTGPRKEGAAKPTLASGGRLVSLVDGREYSVPVTGLVLGRDPACDVVIGGAEASRRHASITPVSNGYIVTDTSTNGLAVNGARVQGTHTLSRGDVLNVAGEEYRFYADAAPAGAAPAAPAAAGATLVAAAPLATTPPPRGSAAAPQGPRGTSAERKLLATLEILNEGLMKGQRFEIVTPLAHVGRGAHNDVVVQDESVSDSHAKLQLRPDGWFVIDLNSTNGTYVGGQRITTEKPLVGAPNLRFGGVKFIFRPVEEAAAMEGKGTRAIAPPLAGKKGAAPSGPPRAPSPSRAETAQPGGRATQAEPPRESSTPARAATPANAATPATASTAVTGKGGIPVVVWIVVAILVVVGIAFIIKSRT